MIRKGRQAIKILRPGGIEESRMLVRADTFNTRVRKMNAWVLNTDGSKRGLDIKSAVSTSLAPDTLYQDTKLLILALPEVTRDSLVGFEWEEEVKPISLEDVFAFQNRFPVLEARYILTFPQDCQPQLDWINWPAEQPLVSPSYCRITIKDIPAISDEPLRPADEAVAGRLLVRFKAAGRAADGRVFTDWKDMGLWYDRLSGERRIPDGSVRAKAQELTEGLTDVRGRLERLAEFVQRDIRYVSIQIGIGGYQPHQASEILADRYGDCKDKATLLAAMLQSLGMDSYYIIVNTERQVVTPLMPVSLSSFNHVVLAVRLQEDSLFAGAEAVVSEEALGRLLIFDPTMPHTSIGRLPFYLRGNCGLLVAGQASKILELPAARSEEPGLVREGRFSLSSDGRLRGQVTETLSGLQAEVVRMKLSNADENQRRKDLEAFLSRTLGSFTLEGYEYRNLDRPSEDLRLRYSFSAGSYLNRSGPLMSFMPGILAMVEDYEVFKQKEARRYPLLLSGPVCARDDFAITLPDGLALEALPEPVELRTDFADYACVFELKGGTLFLKRQVRIKEDLLPAARFDEVVRFFRTLLSEERRRLILSKKTQESGKWGCLE
jgi:hypothetical protein